ncbi:MAG: hypothetical protein AABW59_01420 [archaeon]
MPQMNRSRKPSVNERFRRAVVGAVGARGKGYLSKETPRPIQEMFHPGSQGGPMKGYPQYQMFHELSKLPGERVFRFVDPQKLKNEILKQKGVSTLISQHPELLKGLDQAVKEAVRERGMKGGKFWIRAPKSYIDKIVKGGKGRPSVMNDRAGDIISKKFSGPVRPRTILDIGTFAGGTILGVVRKLSPEQRGMLNIVLVDVAGRTVRNNAIPDLVALGVPRKNIKLIPASFYSAAVAFGEMKRPLHETGDRLSLAQFKQLAGKVDAITAGAATINFATDLQPYLRSIQKLLKPGGTFVNWDWGSAESMRPTVNPKALKKVPMGFTEAGEKVSHYDAYTSFMNFWLRSTLRYPESVSNKFISDLNASKNFNSFNWLKENAAWAEKERESTGARRVSGPLPYRNRAYRTPSSMYNAALKEGFEVEKPVIPFAKPGTLDTGNVNWMVVITKR